MLTYNQLKQKYEALKQKSALIEHSLKERTRSEVKYRLLVENAPVNLLVIDLGGKILFGTLCLNGKANPEFIGESIFTFIPARYRQKMRNNLAYIEETGKKGRFITKLMYNGMERFYEMRIAPVAVAGSIVSYCISIGRISGKNRVAAAAELSQADTAESSEHPGGDPVVICSHCKKIQEQEGGWDMIETYLLKCGRLPFSHGVCPECMKTYYPYLGAGQKAVS